MKKAQVNGSHTKDGNLDILTLKKFIKTLYESHTAVTIIYTAGYSKKQKKQIKANITGVYPNLFTVEECNTNIKQILNFLYVDVITGSIEISDLKVV